ncbi:hypothetical protein IWW37_002454 [Coemansia sp. RSA 2050]|nr:hypothetical protein IWW37_002454 [Coemansia sp. RSA 2050]KAJ2736429.1 hypothetical protein IW152_000790 [Coemansia sp. BCRC 34962]
MRHSESMDDALLTAPAALLRRTGSLLGKLGGLASVRSRQQHFGFGTRSRKRQPLVITRVDRPGPHSAVDLPALDIGEIIRRKDETTAPPPTPLSVSAPSARTLASSENRSSMTSDTTAATAVESPLHVTVQLSLPDDAVRPSTAGGAAHGGRSSMASTRPSASGDLLGRRRLRHDYFRVASMDGQPTIPSEYKCPIAMCESRFEYFESLQWHWTEHPWNRGGILTPVCDGGVRRLGWWEHKRKFFASLAHGKHRPEFPENPGLAPDAGDGTRLRRKSSSIEDVCRSDYGDITLLGSRTYHVSPRVVPMWQVARWEAQRDTKAKP